VNDRFGNQEIINRLSGGECFAYPDGLFAATGPRLPWPSRVPEFWIYLWIEAQRFFCFSGRESAL
jgi:hypothetical protein